MCNFVYFFMLFIVYFYRGLDSASSLVLVTALKTLAAKTNMTICCVIHQPRFEILAMFDKVLFLGQGGRTVYSGPVDEAEAYFSRIGFPMPPYVNPADFYMDVIAGEVKNEHDVHINLIEEWDRHEGSEEDRKCNVVSKDMSQVDIINDGGQTRSSSFSTNSACSQTLTHPKNTRFESLDVDGFLKTHHSESEANSQVEACCQDNKSMSEKLSKKRPGFFRQFWVFFRRELTLQLRMCRTLLLDQALMMIAGAALGLLFREVYIYDVHESTVLGDIISGLGAVVASARRFGQNRVVFWRESASGINRVSYYLAVNIAYIPILLVSPAVYLSLYYSIAAFLAPFSSHYFVFLCSWFCLSGLGYVLSLIMTPRNSQMAAIVTVVIMALLSGGSPELCKLDDTVIATIFYNLSFSRWVAEAIFEIEAKNILLY
ncbi:ABC transporter G family member 28-like isoform X2 [Xenia sp. Carnegie-2017]|uniref:ABC transporter G family member 28-like isoform X2 n=1 Tax=Xenia sp. Carnegie-2017 TaxID=2897299 RepID=UPI001F04D73C|nr:ABC transporter G family member 28-like isoform X2 [Xenia sp. Carnegie-2017]